MSFLPSLRASSASSLHQAVASSSRSLLESSGGGAASRLCLRGNHIQRRAFHPVLPTHPADAKAAASAATASAQSAGARHRPGSGLFAKLFARRTPIAKGLSSTSYRPSPPRAQAPTTRVSRGASLSTLGTGSTSGSRSLGSSSNLSSSSSTLSSTSHSLGSGAGAGTGGGSSGSGKKPSPHLVWYREIVPGKPCCR